MITAETVISSILQNAAKAAEMAQAAAAAATDAVIESFLLEIAFFSRAVLGCKSLLDPV